MTASLLTLLRLYRAEAISFEERSRCALSVADRIRWSNAAEASRRAANRCEREVLRLCGSKEP